ncbi:BREX-1 system phosphatase PglZ type A [Selenomonas noxia]|jgi:TIGR02687 family protein|uniref:BREX-1 system phosphatase PglZ type A n=1 Tax=Selenomonas noxia TaxID=135083 RepID=UPI00235A0F0D|nr:BREX-1 system phosphatase PglZ type A [Selenomonas noxia]
MDMDTIAAELTQRFDALLPDYHRRRIIFWLDEEGAFADELDDLHLPNATLVRRTETNGFALKKLLCADDTEHNYLVYQPFAFADEEDDWLLNLRLAGEEFRSDLVSMRMNELVLPDLPALRPVMKHYAVFFRAKERRAAFLRLGLRVSRAADLHLGVLAAIAGLSEAQPSTILRAMIAAGADELSAALVRYDAEEAFWQLAQQRTGYRGAHDPAQLTAHILLSAASRTLPASALVGLESYISEGHAAFCYDLVSAWLRADAENLRAVAERTEETLDLPARFARAAVDDLLDTECFPCIDVCILSALMQAACDASPDAAAVLAAVEQRRAAAFYEGLAHYYEGLYQFAQMLRFCTAHADGFHLAPARAVWDAYTRDYYRMDSYYRAFHLHFGASLTAAHPALDDLFKTLAERAEGLYVHTFLTQLGENWTNAVAEDLSECGRVEGVPQQSEFYADCVRARKGRVFVIVSDALRYEVAAELAEELRRTMQGTIDLAARAAVFPTITKFGMAALLPHTQLSVEERRGGGVAVRADGQPTEAEDREKILRSAEPLSCALRYTSIIGMKRAERAALVKGMEVVYLYHDRIDEASHTSDAMVFPACTEAIAEILNLVRIIVNDFGGTRILITADHGFLYTYSPLAESDKVGRADFAAEAAEVGRRYALMQGDAAPPYLLPVHFPAGGGRLAAFAPRENIRIRAQGGGMNYVHGGISLQEMMVPVVTYQHLRSSTKGYQEARERIDARPVTLRLVSVSRRVTQMVVPLDFYQEEAATRNRLPATYTVYFADAAGAPVSDTVRIIADRTEEDGAQRLFRKTLHLRVQGYDRTARYALVIADERGYAPEQCEQFTIDVLGEQEEFDF